MTNKTSKRTSWRNLRRTSRFQLTSRFIAILVAILLLVDLVFAGITLAATYQYAQNQSQQRAEAIVKSAKNQPDWTQLLDSFLTKENQDALSVQLPNQTQVTSKEGTQILARVANGSKIPLAKNLRLTQGEFYYFNHYQYASEGYIITLALNITTLLKMNGTIILASLGINLLVLLLGSSLINHFVKKWSASLSQLTKEIHQVRMTPTEKISLQVPTNPQEVQETALAFNELLAKQADTITKEQAFLTNAAHELRTPVAAIRGHIQLILRRGQQNPDLLPSSLQYIDQESKRMAEMIAHILTPTESTADFEDFDLVKMIQELISELASIIPQRIDLTLPPSVIITGVPQDFQEIIKNLLENASKYSPSASSIKLTLALKAPSLTLTVADFGQGIQEKNQQQVFERFFREESARKKAIPGSGIGLALVKDLVEKYQGKIWVTPNQPQGSIFTLVIPLTK